MNSLSDCPHCGCSGRDRVATMVRRCPEMAAHTPDYKNHAGCLLYRGNSTAPNGRSLAERVRVLIDESGVSVNKAARASGVPQPTLARIVMGKTMRPQEGALQKLAAHFGVSVRWLLTGT